MEELIGKLIMSASISSDEKILCFETDSGQVTYEAIGDCCSSSWFQELIGVGNLIGHRVVAATKVDLPNCTPEGYDGSVKAYGVKLITDAGYCDVVYRNESNGYYGGEIMMRSSAPGAGDDMRPITADFDAGDKISALRG